MLEDKIKQRFEELINEGSAVLIKNGWPDRDRYSHPEQGEYMRFRTSSLNLIRRACGESSDHYIELKKIADSSVSSFNSFYYRDCFSILQAAHSDFEAGMLFEVKNLVAADLFSDFLDQARYLLANGFHIPAASLAGAVLEDGLRKLCKLKSLEIPSKTKIDRLNADLARASAYSKLVQKKVTAYADLRNNADHGHFEKVGKEDVEMMIKWIERFLGENIA